MTALTTVCTCSRRKTCIHYPASPRTSRYSPQGPSRCSMKWTRKKECTIQESETHLWSRCVLWLRKTVTTHISHRLLIRASVRRSAQSTSKFSFRTKISTRFRRVSTRSYVLVTKPWATILLRNLVCRRSRQRASATSSTRSLRTSYWASCIHLGPRVVLRASSSRKAMSSGLVLSWSEAVSYQKERL